MSSSLPAPSRSSRQPEGRAKREKSRSSSSGDGILWLGLIPILILVPWWTINAHYHLPTPKIELFDEFGSPQISEHRILSHVSELSDPEKIGFRTVGTKEHAAGDAWAVDRVKELVGLCDDVKATASMTGRSVDLVCEWDRQQGSGTHKFDLMNRIIYKAYQNLTNILLRISSSHEESKTLAILLNSHLDSTLPSPGAADDALAVAISLEVARVLIEAAGKGEWEVGWGIVILLNNAEESFQDASHLFSTQHPWAQTIRTVVNLEAAGSKGPELLFQATSEEMVRVYQGVPYPHGTVLANDIFASGIMMSDTDFRQFDQYLSVPGLDMAVVGHSYFYHTSKDTVENIDPGVAQHFAENVLEIVKRVTEREKNADGTYKPTSLLQRVRKFEDAPTVPQADPLPTAAAAQSSGNTSPFASSDKGGNQHSRRPDVVFYSLFGSTVIVYTGATARILYSVWAIICLGIVWAGHPYRLAPTAQNSPGPKVSRDPRDRTGNPTQQDTPATADISLAPLSHPSLVGRSVLHLVYTLFVAIIYANILAFCMRTLLGRQLTWFAGEWRPVGLYAWPTLLALFTTPLEVLVPANVMPQQKELALLHANLLLYAVLAVTIQFMGVGSAVVFFIISLGVGLGIVLGLVFEYTNGTFGEGRRVPPIVYLLGSVLPLALGIELSIGVLDVFVPLTGRMPPFVPAEHIIATPISVFLFLTLPLATPLASRIHASSANSTRITARTVVSWTLWTATISAVLWYAFISGWGSWPFDPEHPKRIFMSFTEHVTGDHFSLQMASMDGASGFERLVNGAAHAVANVRRSDLDSVVMATIPNKVDFTQWSTEWNPFFPLGELLEHYGFDTLPALPKPHTTPWRDSKNFGIVVRESEDDELTGTRRLVLDMRHRNVIWTVLAFDAHVLSWSLDTPPPDMYTRHHIKEASFYGEDIWTLEMVVRIQTDAQGSPTSGNPANGTTGGNLSPSAIEVSLSGIVEDAMWPGKRIEWTKQRSEVTGSGQSPVTESVAMEIFASVAGWMDMETGCSTDMFGMHNVVWKGVL